MSGKTSWTPEARTTLRDVNVPTVVVVRYEVPLEREAIEVARPVW